MKSKIIILPIALVTLFFIFTAVAQHPAPPHPASPPNPPAPSKPDPLAHLMFPPDLIMGHARQLGLTDEQKAFMRGEIQKTTVSFNELQWKLHDQMELLHDAMKSTSVNEQQALAQLDRVLDVEREIKRLHIGLAVRLKNRLTPEQQEQLHKMRPEHHKMNPGPGGAH
ncbi:MAG TPA: periplasmic heavy metal sensor [Pyrinomonadaceae bacterium]|nr:periplasmic heavy metal sensor [Pyrinomonadaceae bacterium]